jgi:adenosylmethionine---8-amino-7-oxononanoate aminotransferase
VTALEELDRRYVWHPFTQMAEWDPLVIVRGEGNYLIDEAGKRYFDAVSSLWCNVHGHNHPRLNQALVAQANKLAHSTFLGLTHEPAILLAEALVKLVPDGLKKVFYSDSGSAAVEIALKQSFQYWQLRGNPSKQKFVRLENAYHGDTLGAVGVGGIDIFHKIFGPLLNRSIGIPTPYVPSWENRKDGAEISLRALDRALEKASEVAAVVVEPLIQGAGGMLEHPVGYLAAVAMRCRSAGVHLIVDEVATGFGRTGTMFACEQEGVSPDFLCLAKGISGGYLPLAATLCTEEVYSAFLGARSDMIHFFHGHTYTANPLACAVGLESLQMLADLMPRISNLVQELRTSADSLRSTGHVKEVRGRGTMIGIELSEVSAFRVCAEARKLGLMLRPLGDVVVWMPPLSTSSNEVLLLSEGTRTAILNVSRET